jgi:hypothetical protein
MLKRVRSAGIYVSDQWAMFCDADGNEYGLSLESEERS